MAEQIKATDLGSLLQEVANDTKKAQAQIKANGGMCLECGKHPAELTVESVNGYHCIECNKETQKLIEELQSMGGFTQIKL
jgi:hypothetical protein